MRRGAHRTCPHCERRYVVALAELPDWSERCVRWSRGELVQDAFPDAVCEGVGLAANVAREQLISGYCSQACWDAAFAEAES